MTTARRARHEGSAFGRMLAEWRRKRGLSQLDLALASAVSQRHISFLEYARAQPSRDMVLRLATVLDTPLRVQNVLLIAAGFAPIYQERARRSGATAGPQGTRVSAPRARAVSRDCNRPAVELADEERGNHTVPRLAG